MAVGGRRVRVYRGNEKNSDSFATQNLFRQSRHSTSAAVGGASARAPVGGPPPSPRPRTAQPIQPARPLSPPCVAGCRQKCQSIGPKLRTSGLSCSLSLGSAALPPEVSLVAVPWRRLGLAALPPPGRGSERRLACASPASAIGLRTFLCEHGRVIWQTVDLLCAAETQTAPRPQKIRTREPSQDEMGLGVAGTHRRGLRAAATPPAPTATAASATAPPRPAA